MGSTQPSLVRIPPLKVMSKELALQEKESCLRSEKDRSQNEIKRLEREVDHHRLLASEARQNSSRLQEVGRGAYHFVSSPQLSMLYDHSKQSLEDALRLNRSNADEIAHLNSQIRDLQER